MGAKFIARDFAADAVLRVEELSKAFGEKLLFKDLTMTMKGGERIAILGDNGTGKTTLLNIITGRELPDTGTASLGPSVRWAFLPQKVSFPDESLSVLDTISRMAGIDYPEARNRLGAFQFFGDDVFKTVGKLSGGERSRLMLCILMMKDINLLILDEPTNHLDIESREWIEGAVENYTGSLLFVSHDRYFIDRFATRIVEIGAGGVISDNPCDYHEYMEKRVHTAAVAAAELEKIRALSPKKKPAAGKIKVGGIAVEKKISACEKEIAEAEERLSALTLEMADAGSDYGKIETLLEKKELLEDEIAYLYGEWEEYTTLLEGGA